MSVPPRTGRSRDEVEEDTGQQARRDRRVRRRGRTRVPATPRTRTGRIGGNNSGPTDNAGQLNASTSARAARPVRSRSAGSWHAASRATDRTLAQTCSKATRTRVVRVRRAGESTRSPTGVGWWRRRRWYGESEGARMALATRPTRPQAPGIGKAAPAGGRCHSSRRRRACSSTRVRIGDQLTKEASSRSCASR